LWGLLFSVPLIRTIVWIHATGHFFQHSPRVCFKTRHSHHPGGSCDRTINCVEPDSKRDFPVYDLRVGFWIVCLAGNSA
jgi:hypothetical protein